MDEIVLTFMVQNYGTRSTPVLSVPKIWKVLKSDFVRGMDRIVRVKHVIYVL